MTLVRIKLEGRYSYDVLVFCRPKCLALDITRGFDGVVRSGPSFIQAEQLLAQWREYDKNATDGPYPRPMNIEIWRMIEYVKQDEAD